MAHNFLITRFLNGSTTRTLFLSMVFHVAYHPPVSIFTPFAHSGGKLPFPRPTVTLSACGLQAQHLRGKGIPHTPLPKAANDDFFILWEGKV